MDNSSPMEVTRLRSVGPVNDETESSNLLAIVPYIHTIDEDTHNTSPVPLMVAPLRTIRPFQDSSNNIKRRRGRPPGSKNKKPKTDTANHNAAAPFDGSYVAAPTKRGPGRQKGSKNKKPKTKEEAPTAGAMVLYDASNNSSSRAPIKRGPGRPKGRRNSTKKPKTKEEAPTAGAMVLFDPSINSSVAGPSSAPVKRGPGRPKGKKNSTTTAKKPKTDNPGMSRKVTSCPNFDSGISEAERESGNHELTSKVLMRFDAARRRLGQLGYESNSHLVASINCNNLGVHTNRNKRVGPVPGLEVGDIFYFWAEMYLVGLHRQNFAGIDYLTTKNGGPLATSIVTSGHYDDQTEDLETIIYTGQGGGEDKKGQLCDQKLRKGNLAMQVSSNKGNDVRVIRGEVDPSSKKKKIYIYDGLYSVTECWEAKGKAGYSEFKFRLVRKPDQPSGYAIWKSAERLRKTTLIDARKGLLLKDISNGAETLPIPVVNEVDEEIPQAFTYTTSLDCPLQPLSVTFTTPRPPGCVDCRYRPCSATHCVCIKKNGGGLPYLNRTLVCRKPMVYECGDVCPCFSDCPNRVVQTGLKIRLEVFKTENCGWGLRSWEPIRAGTFICEFTGRLKEEEEEDDEYQFDTSRICNRVKWNCEPQLVGDDVNVEQVSEDFKLPRQILIRANKFGNVGRFMNHGCSPNVLWQPVECQRNGEPCLRIAFFAMKHIPPLQELRYDYGASVVEEGGGVENLLKGKKICLCGSVNCRGSFG